jgi:hypothetical protein
MRLLPSPALNPVRTVAPVSGTGPTPIEPTPAALQQLLAAPDVRRIKVGQQSLEDALDAALRFRFVGAGALASRTIVADSPGAARALAGEHGQAVRDAVLGMLTVLDNRHQGMTLAGLSLAPDTSSFAANVLVSDTELRLAAGEHPSARDLARSAADLVKEVDGAYGMYDSDGWMHLDPSTSAEFTERIAAGPGAPTRPGELVATLQHELEHAITPSTDAEYTRMPWLEEAEAELLTQWSGAIGEMAGGMHLAQVSAGHVAYRPQVEALETWIRRTGLEPTHQQDLAAARKLLQSGTLGETPGRIASAIVAHEHAGDPATLARQIERAFAENAWRQVAGPRGIR